MGKVVKFTHINPKYNGRYQMLLIILKYKRNNTEMNTALKIYKIFINIIKYPAKLKTK